MLCCFMGKSSSSSSSKKGNEKEEERRYAVEAGSLSNKPQEIHKSSAPIVVSYFPVNSQPSRL